MLHFLKRRLTGATPAPFTARNAQGTDQVSAGDVPQMPTPELASDMLHHILRRFARTDQFQGAFDTCRAYQADVTPDLLEVTKHQIFLAGGVVNRTSLTLSFAGITGPHLAKLGVDVVMEDLFDISPVWESDAAEACTTRLPFGPPKHWMTFDCVTQPVDPWLSGQMVDGATLCIEMVEVS